MTLAAFLLAAMISGPIRCTVVRVIDGDTLEASCQTWIGTTVDTMVRVRGIDTPEKAPRSKCPAEAALAVKASAFTKAALPPGATVSLTQIDNDKFGGRVDAVVGDLAERLIAAGLARAYDGGTKGSWCYAP